SSARSDGNGHDTCPPNYYGPECQVFCKAEDSCEGGHYTCNATTGAKVCKDGWDLPELNCNLKIIPKPIDEDCPDTGTTCGAGQCHNKSCCCFENWTGPTCDIPIDCSNNQCGNGSTCVTVPDGYQCLCGPHYYGSFCNIYCKPADDCQNGHYTCDSISGAKDCLEGWETPEINCTVRIIPPPLDTECPHEHVCVNGQCHKKSCCCLSGWTGQFCEMPINECLSEPCQNQGTCRKNIGIGYECMCLPNYYGRNCETLCKSANDCIHGHYECNTTTGEKICLDGWALPNINCTLRTVPPIIDPECPENGVCVGGQCHKNQCCCFDQWTGDFCDIRRTSCTSNPCKNDGTCISTDEGYTCICHPEYTGTQCETYDPKCPPNYYNPPACNVYCLAADDCERGHYTCDPNTGAIVCLPGYSSPQNNCKIKTIPPSSDPDCPADSPCGNGRCYRQGCCCNEHYTGPRCIALIDYCLSQPCFNGGICSSMVGSYICTCPRFYTGIHCETYDPQCPPNYYNLPGCNVFCLAADDCNRGHYICNPNTGAKVCLPGYTYPEMECKIKTTPPPTDPDCPRDSPCIHGRCYKGGCCCDEHYTGHRCETYINYCTSQPCFNGGTCNSMVGGFICSCLKDFTGIHCETYQPQCPLNYYNPPACNVHCLAADDCDRGHYTCNPNTGTKVCLDSYTSPDFDCKIKTIPPPVDPDCPRDSPCVYGRCYREGCCCDNYYTGDRCETFIDYCASSPCKNGGTCNPKVGGYTCNCCQNFEGTDCETYIHRCPPGHYGHLCEIFCQPQNDCSGHYTCDCQTGYKKCIVGWMRPEYNCIVKVIPPDSDIECPVRGPCLNGGACFQNRCCCTQNFRGDECEIEKQPCERHECQNGATCLNLTPGLDGIYKCICTPRWTGVYCDIWMLRK
ncbi:unnamed protein product, partial [Owenia fusiformis]